MKNKILKSILMLLTAMAYNTVNAQENLVPNPSFEEYESCPDGWGWASFTVQNWFRSNGTPDYYNSCDNNPNCLNTGVPCNIAGFQYPKEGNGYVGIGIYQIAEPSDYIFREFVGVELISPLEKGKRYYVSMYVSLSTLEFSYNSHIACAANNIGFRFTNIIGDNGSGGNIIPVDNVAHVYCDTIISDTLNWTRVSGSFIADSAYRYLIIGNHFDNTHTMVFCTDTQLYSTAYYYIDEVNVSTDSTVGIDGVVQDTEKIEVYPNPANNTIYLNKQRSVIDYAITDVLGKIVQSENNYSFSQINVEKVPNGIYYLTINKKQIRRISIFHNN